MYQKKNGVVISFSFTHKPNVMQLNKSDLPLSPPTTPSLTTSPFKHPDLKDRKMGMERIEWITVSTLL